MTFADTVRFLHALGPELKPGKWDLSRIETVLAELGNPHRNRRCIHVTGTNGKGSTCAMMAAGILAAGARVGLYTSPHLISPRERIEIDGAAVAEAAWVDAFSEVHAASEKLLAAGAIESHPSYFETLTAMAFVAFEQARVDAMVVEVGMGGLRDATNVVDSEIAVFTPIDFDHESFLGLGLESITREKSGILRPHRRAVIAPQRREVLDILEARAGELGVTIDHCESWPVQALSIDRFRSSFTLAGPVELTVHCPLAGAQQVENARTAAIALHRFGISGEAITRGIARAVWPGRLECVSRNPVLMLDGAHNPAGARALRQYIQDFFADEPVRIVYGAMRDKAVEEVTEILFPLAAEVVVTTPSQPRAVTAETLAAMSDHPAIHATANVSEALWHIEARPMATFITGSLFLVGEARSILRNDATAALLAVPKFGAGVGLHRMLWFTRELPAQDWLRGLDAIKVTGSKGKGSVCAVTEAILRHAGVRTGLFTSPHLLRFHERIQVNGCPISETDLRTSAAWALDAKTRYEGLFPGDTPGAFEVCTAAALHHFSRENVEVVVAEAGIGGRYDSTRVLPGPLAALTSVELEHTAILGNSTELIAFDKADLCPSGGALVAGRIEPSLLRRLEAYCRIRNVDLLPVADHLSVSAITWQDHQMVFDLTAEGLGLPGLQTRLLGEHQAWNIGVAILLTRRWLAAHRPDMEPGHFEHAIRTALRELVWPGRLQLIAANPDVLIDVGHTPQSLRSLVATMREAYADKPVLLVTGVSIDKDIAGVLTELVPGAASIICTKAWHKGAPASRIAEHCESVRPGSVRAVFDTIEEAVDAARTRAAAENMRVLVAGGLFLAIEAMTHIQGGNPRDLRFF